MKSPRNLLKLAALALSISLPIASAADDFEEFKRRMTEDFDNFAKKAKTDYEGFREKANAEYAEFMRNPWKPSKLIEALTPPKVVEPKPDVIPENEDPQPREDRAVIIEEIITPVEPEPQPQPVEPIRTVPVEQPLPDVTLTLYGTPVSVRGTKLKGFRLNGRTENDFANGWETLSAASTNNLIADCLSVRDRLRLPDWTYIKFLDQLAGQLTTPDSNEQTLLTGFLLNQSGYKVRFCYDEARRLHMLFASSGTLYGRQRVMIDREWFYAFTPPKNAIYTCNFRTPKEKPVSMAINASPALSYTPGNARRVEVKTRPDLTVSLTPNKNLIDLFGDYPESALTDSPYSKWQIHGNTPVSPEVNKQLYPTLRKAVEGMNQYDAVNLLLKVAQSFPYEFDDKVWGRDRAFWMEESWHYPFSDCEDHAVNFSHMVRDILGLDVCLIYYPGHLSACVAITDGTGKGDYLTYQGRRYTVCDATYFYAHAGLTAPSNNNSEAILVPLAR